MPTLLFKLRNVPEDEAQDIRRLLDRHQVDYYETSGGRWGLGMPGFWAADTNNFHRGRALIDRYEEERRQRHRELHRQLRAEGKSKTFFDGIRSDPLRILLYIAIIAVIAYFSVKPFLDFGQ